jgi:microcystin-dependent protein
MKRLLATAALGCVLQMTGSGLASAQQVDNYLGELRNVGFNFCPTGWFQASGQLLAIQQYTALFSLFGTTYGGDGIRSFGLPNLNGSTPYGQSTQQPIGAVFGSTTLTLTTANMPQHNHPYFGSTTGPGINSPQGALAGTLPTGENGYAPAGSPANVPFAASAVGFTGGNQPVYIQSPALAMNWCVAYQGIFPTRN